MKKWKITVKFYRS